MLIINADDWGKDEKTTDNICICYKNARISSTTAMMFMEDSERAAKLALENNFDVGLHLNFTELFTSKDVDNKLLEYQRILINFFTSCKYARILYNPIIKKQLEYSFRAQYDEFLKLYAKPPTHIDGHHHIHLCSNLMFAAIIPSGTKIRRNFSFSKGEKGIVTRTYRGLIDRIIESRFLSTDFFYKLDRHVKKSEILEKLSHASDSCVEFMVHPGLPEEYAFIMSDKYKEIIQNAAMGSYEAL